MTTKIVEIIAKILDGLYKNIPLEEINKKLSKDKSFDKQTLSTAFSWIMDKKLDPDYKEKYEPFTESFRILTPEEIEILGMDNYNYFMHLLNIGLLQTSEMNAILDQMFLVPGTTISKDEINWIILFSLLGRDDSTLPGSRFLLYSSDTIN